MGGRVGLQQPQQQQLVLQKLGNCRGGCLVLAVSTAIVWAAAIASSSQQLTAAVLCPEHSKNRMFFCAWPCAPAAAPLVVVDSRQCLPLIWDAVSATTAVDPAKKK